VRRTVRRLATRAGLPADLTSHLGPRTLQHTFATLYLQAGGSLSDLHSAMGHADPRTTQRYDQARRTPVIDLAQPQQRHQAPPARQARDPGSGPWPRGRPHCRARQSQRAAGHTRPRLSRLGKTPSPPPARARAWSCRLWPPAMAVDLQPQSSRHSWSTDRIPGTQRRHRTCGHCVAAVLPWSGLLPGLMRLAGAASVTEKQASPAARWRERVSLRAPNAPGPGPPGASSGSAISMTCSGWS